MAEASGLGIEHSFCHHSACAEHARRGAGDLSSRGFGGRDRRIRVVYCRACKRPYSQRKGTALACKRSYSQRKGTALERSRLPADKAVSVPDHLEEGAGVRATSRLTGACRDTVSRLLAKAGDQAKLLHDGLVDFPPP